MTRTSQPKEKEYTAFIDIYSSTGHLLTDKELFEIGIKSDAAEHRKNKNNETFWRIESGLSDKAMLSEHISALRSLIISEKPVEGDLHIKKVYLSIGVYFFGTVTCTVNIPVRLLKPILAKFPDIEIEITCYPSTK